MSDITAWLICAAAIAALWGNGYFWYRVTNRDVCPRWWTIPFLNGFVMSAKRMPDRYHRSPPPPAATVTVLRWSRKDPWYPYAQQDPE